MRIPGNGGPDVDGGGVPGQLRLRFLVPLKPADRSYTLRASGALYWLCVISLVYVERGQIKGREPKKKDCLLIGFSDKTDKMTPSQLPGNSGLTSMENSALINRPYKKAAE